MSPPRPKSWGARCSRGGSFSGPLLTREKGVFVAIDADDFPSSRRGAATFSAQLHLPTHIASRYDPSGDASPRAVDVEPARVACSRASPARRRSRSRFSCLSREEKLLPRTRHRVVRRLTRAPPPTPPNPPQMASKDGSTFFFTSESVNEGHPDKLADQVRDRAFLDSGALFQRGPSLFRQTGSSENEPRRRRSVASTAIIATCFGRSADETSSPHHPTDLRRCPRYLPRPGSRLQGASPAA